MTRRNAVILALLVVILVVEILVVAPKELGTSVADDLKAANEIAEANRKSEADRGASGQIMRDVHLVEAKGEGKEWELWADRALRPKDNEQWTIEKVKVNFFAENGVMYTVTGERGQVRPETKDKDIRIDGDVVTRSSNGYVFKTQTVDYNSKARRLLSPSHVEMLGPRDKNGGDLHLAGGALDANFATNEINITKNVRATRKIWIGSSKQEKTARIQAQRALFSGRTNLAQFFGNVVIDVDAMQIAGPKAKFSYDAKTQALDAFQVDGGVKVTDADKFATSGAVDLFLKEDRVVFSGSPRVVQNGDELIGDEIILTDGGKKVQVSNAKAQIEPKEGRRQ